jgi:EAL and modified HD-GYP domain-containing signal transduction protein
MELLVEARGKSSRESDYPERAFITGILSLADVLFETSMEEILDHLNLTEDIRGALISREGPLGALLKMVEKLERNEFGAVSQLLEIHYLTADELLTAQMSSFDWANGLREFM